MIAPATDPITIPAMAPAESVWLETSDLLPLLAVLRATELLIFVVLLLEVLVILAGSDVDIDVWDCVELDCVELESVVVVVVVVVGF